MFKKLRWPLADLTYEQYFSQVVTYLEPEYQTFYEPEDYWTSMVDDVATLLQAGETP